ncbi:PREDICTED: putative Polycomb group protein ASXL1 [Gekko japonicus]|uniref:Polycomb group protein ASXL1 n=1 Tax=Gekko japonicus TaxID=146911 RepID=A0ABM1L6R9_GEKJA|nr:PREDICTED: putative Polycomb group protein ASXL1 [Gekko japonicus]
MSWTMSDAHSVERSRRVGPADAWARGRKDFVQVLENYSDGPMTPKQILQVIESEGLKETSGTSPLACLNAMLHSNSRSCDGLFYKLPGRISLFSLKKDAVQWSRSLSAPEGEELDDAVDAESSGSNEASTVSGDNDVSLDETSSNASCSTEPQSKNTPALRESHRAASQTSKQKKKTGVMLPRVVLTPLKVNGAHMETSSGFTGRQAGSESSSSSSALPNAAARSRTEIARDPSQLLRGFRKPAGGQMKRNRGDDIDFETPGSILVNTNLRALINSRTFNALPLPFQQQLLLLLPEVDRQAGADGLMRLSGSALNNEFFTHAAQSWRERLADGEFTHEMQVRIRQEMEKEKKTEQWKERFFEDYYGQKLGLTREELPEQNSVPDDTKNGTAQPSPGGPVRTQPGPVTRQRDGHFKKRSLRCRTLRSLHKPREQEPAESALEAAVPAEPEPPSCRAVEPEVDSRQGSQAPPQPESPPKATRLPSEGDDAAPAAAAGRVPALPQESHDQEPKEQKRKCFEQAASASFPEKKPRLEDRQSFRNTIESVHPEKPQPTKEEPKVPPIRIQLSRIKPPWVVKGQPAYQICPRIIPNPEPSGPDRNGAAASADFKACAVPGGAQRETAAPASAIGGGGGPGGGGGGSPDEGGGRGGGGSGGSGTRSRGRQSRGRPKRWRSKRAHRKCLSNLQRTQLLPLPHLEQPGPESARRNSPMNEKSASPPRAEGAVAVGQTAGTASLALEGVACIAEASGSGHSDSSLAKLPPDCLAVAALGGTSGHLPSDVSGGRPQGAHNQQEGTKLPLGSCNIHSRLEDSPVSLLGDTHRADRHGSGHPVLLTHKETSSSGSSGPVADLACESTEPGGTEVEERPATGLRAGEGLPDPRRSDAVGVEDAAPQFHLSSPPTTPQRHGEERPSGSDKDGACQTKPVPLLDGFSTPPGAETPQSSLPAWEAGTGVGGEEPEAMLSTDPVNDEETRSVLSETTETASDLEAELTDESAELNLAKAEGGPAPSRSGPEGHDGTRSESSARTDFPRHRGDLSSAVQPVGLCWPEEPMPRSSPAPEAAAPSVRVDLERPGPPLPPRTCKLLSVEASNPLMVKLLKARLPLSTVLPGAPSSTSVGIADQPPARQCSALLGSQSAGGHVQGPRQAEGLDMNGAAPNGHPAPRCLRDSPQRHYIPGPPASPREGQEKPADPGTCPDFSPSSGSAGRAVRATQQPAKLSPAGGLFSPHACKGPKDSATSAKPVPGGSLQETLKPTQFSPPGGTPLDRSGGASVPQNQGVQGKKVFGSGFPCSTAPQAQRLSRVPVPCPIKRGPAPPPKSPVPRTGAPAVREDWPPKPRVHIGGGGGVENKRVPACPGPAKRNVEKRKEAPPSPLELMEQLQGIPLVRDLPFFKLPREPGGKGLAQPLEPSSIPSQLNIKQAFYGKLSKLQLSPAAFRCASSVPVSPRSLAESVMQLSHKANFAASRGVSLSAQMFAGVGVEEVSLKCSCRLKAMILCKGCGAFCHDDCIGPSKLCVLCLVVR